MVEAIANPGYVLLNWTEAGNVVSTAASYSFTSEVNRSLEANFIAQPALSHTVPSPGGLTISWPAGSVGWFLQECSDLGIGNWSTSTRPVNIVGGQKQVTVPPGSANCFFRLAYP